MWLIQIKPTLVQILSHHCPICLSIIPSLFTPSNHVCFFCTCLLFYKDKSKLSHFFFSSIQSVIFSQICCAWVMGVNHLSYKLRALFTTMRLPRRLGTMLLVSLERGGPSWFTVCFFCLYFIPHFLISLSLLFLTFFFCSCWFMVTYTSVWHTYLMWWHLISEAWVTLFSAKHVLTFMILEFGIL